MILTLIPKGKKPHQISFIRKDEEFKITENLNINKGDILIIEED